jgi:ankyrin repeat protein
MVNILLQNGADVNAKARNGAKRMKKENCPTIMQYDCFCLNEQDRDGRTALTWASENGNEEIVKWLIKFGANVNVRVRNWMKYHCFIVAKESHNDSCFFVFFY